MDKPNEDEAPQEGLPSTRRRAPTITIDTAGVNSNSDNTDVVYQPTDLHTETANESKGSRPVTPQSQTSLHSPHNVSSPGAAAFLAVPGQSRDRQSSIDSSDGSSQGDTTMIDSITTGSDKHRAPTSNNDLIMNDPDALKPDVGTESHFQVEDNPFAFSPGQLTKMFNPKNLAAFYKLGGLAGLERGLHANRKTGLSVDETQVSGRISFEEATGRSDKSVTEASTSHQESKTPTGRGGQPYEDRLRVFKDNRIPQKKGKSLLQLMWITFNDKVLILLSIAAVVSLAVGLYQTFGGEHEPGTPKVEWVEGVAIIVAIAIVVIVGSLNDYSKERQFAKLNKKKQDRSVKVIRSGRPVEISVYDILVGDVVQLEPGDLVPVDGILIEGFDVKCDESQATGESDVIRKQSADVVFRAIENNENLKKMDPFIQSGARIMEGVGTYLATSTGIYSSYGKTLMALNEDPEMTPLQGKLNAIATWIAKIGSAAGLLLFIVLFIKFLVKLPRELADETPAKKGQDFLNIFIMVVTIIVVAVPEGLPLAVTLALAFATRRMLKDANLVRHLKACEVMGNATSICSDKTGTLTQNVMQVVSGTVGTSFQFGGGSVNGEEKGPESDVTAQDFASKLTPSLKDLLRKSIALNSTAFEGEVDGKKTFIGSKTETALLLFAQAHFGMGPVNEERESEQILQLIPFDSGRKCMGIVVKQPNGGARLYIKGASEIILAKCTQVLHNPAADDSVTAMAQDDINDVLQIIESYANRSLRTIAIAHRDFESWPPRGLRRVEDAANEIAFEELFKDLVFDAVVGIQDPLRPGVYDAVKLCQKAGVTVRMVTGDNKLTAQAIAKECGILQADGIVMEGPEFRNLSKLKQQEIIPQLQVLARSSPEDKRVLVKRLKEKDEIVAVTGDGTNDAPALTTADVGFSMGIAGTEVAKEASSIILMDDNFTSIVKALKWGRAVNDAVKRFLQFQLTVNVTAVVLTFVTAVSSNEMESVLTAVQLLWVNLIMDTLAALALATDPPHDSVLDRKPEPRHNFIITTTMWKMIMGQAVYQLVITFLLYYGGAAVIPVSEPPSEDAISTLVFNTFVWMQIFNQWNNRRLDNKFNIFEGLSKNWFFIGISALMCGGQVLIVFVGGEAFKIRSKQTAELWGVALVLGFLSIPVGVLVRLIPDSYVEALIPKFLKRKARNVPGLTVSDEEMGMYPEPLAEVRNELQFLRRMKGGRLNNLKFAIQHPRETIMRSRSASHSRTNSFQNVRGTGKEDHPGSLPTTPDGLRLSLSARSRSNSLLGAPTVMAGLVAAGVAAGWSPAGRVPSEKDEDEKARQENQGEEKKNGDAKANGGDAKTEK